MANGEEGEWSPRGLLLDGAGLAELAERLGSPEVPPVLEDLGGDEGAPAGEEGPAGEVAELLGEEVSPSRTGVERATEWLVRLWQWLLRSLLLQDAGPVPGQGASSFVYTELDRAAPPVEVVVLPPDAIYLCWSSGRRLREARRAAAGLEGENRDADNAREARAQAERALREEGARARQERDAAASDPEDGEAAAGDPLPELDRFEDSIEPDRSTAERQRNARSHGRGGATYLLQVEVGTVWQRTTVVISGQERQCCRLAYVDLRTTWVAMVNGERRLFVRDWSGAEEELEGLAGVDVRSDDFASLPRDERRRIGDALERLADRGDRTTDRTRFASLGAVAAHERGHIRFFLDVVRGYLSTTRFRRCADTQGAVREANRQITGHLTRLVWAIWDAMTTREADDYPRGLAELYSMLVLHGFLNEHPPDEGEDEDDLEERHLEIVEETVKGDREALSEALEAARETSDGLTEHCQELDEALDRRPHPFQEHPDRCFPPD